MRMTRSTGGGPSGHRAGDRVRVLPRERIAERLDSLGRLDGCLFMEEMWRYCEEELTVLKPVRHLFDEHRLKMFRPTAPIYVLEGAICDGRVEPSSRTCDHCCYLLWHEDWLEGVG